MLRRPILVRAFLMGAVLAIACAGGLPLLATGADGASGIQPPRHGTEESREKRREHQERQEQAAQTRVTMQGRVVDSYESFKGVPGATIEFVKGPNAGRSTIADSRGAFSFSDLTPGVGGHGVRISHPGYRTSTFEPAVWFNKVSQFNPRLTPLVVPPKAVAAMLTATDSFRGSISSAQAVCDMPDQDYPCEKFRLSSASGKTSLSAELTWTTPTYADLDLILYDNGRPIARSVSSGSKKDVLNARISGSGPFDIRVIAAPRGGRASFTLAVKRTN